MLSEQHHAQLHRESQRHVKTLRERGFEVRCGNDPAAFGVERLRFEDEKLHPAFDPRSGAQIRAEHFVWLSLEREGKVCGLIASRLFEGSLGDLLHCRRLWGFDCPTIDEIEPFPSMPNPELAASIKGPISLQGGTVLTDECRGQGVTIPLSKLVRLVSFRWWQENWQIALHLPDLDQSGRRFRSYGYEERAVLFNSPVSPGPNPRHQSEILVYVSRESILESLLPNSVAGSLAGITPMQQAV